MGVTDNLEPMGQISTAEPSHHSTPPHLLVLPGNGA